MIFQEEKQTQPLTQDRTLTWETAVSSSFSSCAGSFSHQYYVEESHQHLENMPSTVSAQLLHLLPARPQAEGPWNAEKADLSCPSSQERFRNNQLLHGDQSMSFSLLSTLLLSSYKRPKILLTWGMWASPTSPLKADAEQNLLPLLGPKLALNSHKYTQKPTYLTLASP